MTTGRAVKHEIQDLKAGMDFRRPEYRREVFLRFYEFHLKYRAHPGCVYYLLPYLARAGGWSQEQALWFAYLNGNTQNPVTSWLIFREFPDVGTLDLLKFHLWVTAQYKRLEFDTDRRYFKTRLVECVGGYQKLLAGGTQAEFFQGMTTEGNPEATFRRMWRELGKKYAYFGRLSLFSYLEYLKISGVPVECDQLFLDDMAGSRSHRNGLCKVLGRDDLDWHDSNPGFDGGYTAPIIAWLENEGRLLRDEAKRRLVGRDFAGDVGYFTLESTLCTYKGWHRENRRYPNVYNDMLVGRIRKAEQAWGERLEVFWAARQEALPIHLRLEDNPADPGVQPAKQTHYRLTGEVIMLDREWPCFANEFNARLRGDA